MIWTDLKVFITGGASFIGTNLVARLVWLGSEVTILDDLSSGNYENIKPFIDSGQASFIKGDILNIPELSKLLIGHHIVFHLAAVHGGRGFIERNDARCSRNFAIDNLIINAAVDAHVDKFVFASSGCVYPVSIQSDTSVSNSLSEKLVKSPFEADNLYGWAKLMAELTLRAFYKEGKLQSACCRLFAVYGPYATESHSIMALIARGMIKQNPFEIWGDGSQIRNWTYVDDTIDGLILAAEYIRDGEAINIGTDKGYRLSETAKLINDIMGHRPDYQYLTEMPTGPKNRVADASLAKKVLGWYPKTSLETGIKQTIEWYSKSRSDFDARKNLEIHK